MPKTLFAGKKFALFCLGDRAYGPQFCAAGRKLAVRLLQLGMVNCCEVGYGDDNTPNGGVFRDLDKWLEQTLLPYAPIRNGPTSIPVDQITTISSPYRIKIDSTNPSAQRGAAEEWLDGHFEAAYREFFRLWCPINAYSYTDTKERFATINCGQRRGPLQGRVVTNDRITSAEWDQNTRHIQIRFAACLESAAEDPVGHNDVATLPYFAGDIATIMPCNSDAEVQRFLEVLPTGLQGLADFVIETAFEEELMNNSFSRWPRRCSLRGWLKYCADIHSLPEREDLRALSPYCSKTHERGKDQQEKLVSMSETKGAALYADYILREKRSWIDLLYDFDSLRDSNSGITLEALFALLPPIRPRHFSIASAPSTTIVAGGLNMSPSGDSQIAISSSFTIDLCVAVVEGTTPLGRSYHGLCSEYLSRLIPSSAEQPIVQVWIRPGSFSGLPLQVTTTKIPRFEIPILCIGAGTGIAPLRSLIMERDAILSYMIDKSNCASLPETGSPISEQTDHDNILVFGCRKRSVDYYYQEDWRKIMGTSSRRLRVLTAFSRDQAHKVYVQKVLEEADGGSLICEHLLKRHGAVYIAGGPQMAKCVKDEIVSSLGKDLGSAKQANQFLAKLQRIGKFSVEAWS